MAYDKIVDSAFLEAGLKKVSDSIRAKAGTSELLEFPNAMSAAVDAIDTSEDLSAELAEYTALNAELEEVIDNLPDAGSGGGTGGELETCTVNIDSGCYPMILQRYVNGGILPTHYCSYAPEVYTDVICGSAICPTHKVRFWESDGLTFIYNPDNSIVAFVTPLTNSGPCSIWYEEDMDEEGIPEF